MKCGALIVSFNPSLDCLINSIQIIIPQVDKVVVVDNGSDNFRELEKKLSDLNVHLIANGKNKGIAYALNQGMHYLETLNYEWVITLDQDSTCPENIIKVFTSYTNLPKIGIICPRIDYSGYSKKIDSSMEIQFTDACMTSASFTNVNAWKKVGGFAEHYFIDFVDNEFCKKLEIHGYRIVQVNYVILKHNLGDSRTIRILFFRHLFGEHSPVRSYYIVRNNLQFIRDYKKNINVSKEILKLLYIVLEIIIFSGNKRKHLFYIKKGIADFKIKKMGSINS